MTTRKGFLASLLGLVGIASAKNLEQTNTKCVEVPLRRLESKTTIVYDNPELQKYVRVYKRTSCVNRIDVNSVFVKVDGVMMNQYGAVCSLIISYDDK